MLEPLSLDIRCIVLVASPRAQYAAYPRQQDHMILNSFILDSFLLDGDCIPPYGTPTSLR